MSVAVTFNGSSYIVPTTNDVGWGTNLTNYLVAIAAGCLQKTGGAFTLSAETDFGASFGLKSLYYKSHTTNPASTGQVRLATSDNIAWRNFANSADLLLTTNASNELVFNGAVVATGGGAVSPGTQYEMAYYPTSGSTIAGNPDIYSVPSLLGDFTFLYPTSINGGALGTQTNHWNHIYGKLIDAGSATGLVGEIRIFPGTASRGHLTIASTESVSGDPDLFLTNAPLNASRTYTIPEVGADADFVMTQGDQTLTGQITFSAGQTLFGDGTLSLPSIALSANTDTGFYATGSSTVINTAINASKVFEISSVGTGHLDGSASQPSIYFINDIDTGICRPGANNLVISTGGTTAVDISDTQVSIEARQFIIPSSKKLLIDGSGVGDTYLIETSANLMDFFAGGTNVISAQSSGVAIRGTNTNDSAASGFIGEYIESAVGTTAYTTSGNWSDVTSISLTAGDWDVTLITNATANGATVNTIQAGISTTSGNSTTGLTVGSNQTQSKGPVNGVNGDNCNVPNYRMSLSATTTVYGKISATFSVATPNISGARLSARRVR